VASTASKGLGAGIRASIQQPKGPTRNYVISNPIPQDARNMDYGRPSSSVPPKFAKVAGFPGEGQGGEVKGHRRSNTIGEIGGKIFGRSGSIFGGRSRKKSEQPQQAAERSRKYPPVSMSNSMAGGDEPRPSMDSKRSRRSFSLGFGKKRSGSIEGSQTSQEKQPRRFSLLPGSFSLKAIGIGKDYGPDSQQDLPIQDPPRVDQRGRYIDQSIGSGNLDANALYGMYTQLSDPQQQTAAANASSPAQQRLAPGQHGQQRPSAIPPRVQSGAVLNSGSDSSVDNMQRKPPRSAPQQADYENLHGQDSRRAASRGHRGVLQKNKRMADAYDTDDYSRPHDHSGSSGAARRVMDFFRRMGKARGEEDR